MRTDGLILAAGRSSRFGGCKLLSHWQGKTLLDRTIAAAQSLPLASLAIVTGAYHREIRTHCERQGLLSDQKLPITLLHFAEWPTGMGTSLAYGVANLPVENALLILLGDQPLVSGEDLEKLYAAWQKSRDRICCARFAGTFGVPALFPANIKNQLSALRGDRGAKNLLQQQAANLDYVNMEHAAFDIDTPEDLLHLQPPNPLSTQ